MRMTVKQILVGTFHLKAWKITRRIGNQNKIMTIQTTVL